MKYYELRNDHSLCRRYAGRNNKKDNLERC